MDAPQCGCIRSDPRFEVVLCFVIEVVGQVVDIEVQIQPRADRLGHSQIQDIQTRRAYRRILCVEAIVSNVPVTQRTIEASPARQYQTAVRNGVRCAVYIDSKQSASIKEVHDLRKSTVERKVSNQTNRHLSFVAIGT